MGNKASNSSNDASKEDIIQQLMKFNIGTRQEIIYAINHVINKNDINEIAEFVMKRKEKQQYYPSGVGSVKCIQKKKIPFQSDELHKQKRDNIYTQKKNM